LGLKGFIVVVVVITMPHGFFKLIYSMELLAHKFQNGSKCHMYFRSMCMLHLEVSVPLTLTKQAQRKKKRKAAQIVFPKQLHIHTLYTNQTSHTSGFFLAI